ncbi:RidA family protein [Denitrobaculum tricleocarpae]|uniref:RidA family protein n=2 Tax=Denitrobaculum tricleocarpae TaxID=2591009 RepID=A0A545TYG1_9PROT|nr:RidA family protein [Denitrobaculum tricleocarpae]
MAAERSSPSRLASRRQHNLKRTARAMANGQTRFSQSVLSESSLPQGSSSWHRPAAQKRACRTSVMNTSTRHDPYPVRKPFHGIYAHGVETRAGARIMHVSGQVGATPKGDLALDFQSQCRQAITNLQSVLQEADMELDDIVKLGFFLVRREDMDDLVEVRKEMLYGVRPAITTVFVAGLVSPDWLVEVEAIACAA